MQNSYKLNPEILRAYDIRGIVGENLNVIDAYYIGRAFATIVKRRLNKELPVICVGKDGRLSSPELKSSLIEGLKVSGVKIIDIGVGPTPMTYYAAHKYGCDAAIMVTGSHNPFNHNGFKMTVENKPFFGESIQEISEICATKNFVEGKFIIDKFSVEDEYVDYLLTLQKNSKKKLKVAWDIGNGATGEVMQKICARLGGENILINALIDGNFPAHSPDPTDPKNLVQLIDVIKMQNCDFGIAFDGDGDRLVVLDHEANIINGDQLITLLAAPDIKGCKIIYDIKASQALLNYVTESGGYPILWKSGHSFIKSKMAEEKADLAGEMSGHIFFASNNNFDDGIYAALKLYVYMATQNCKLADLVAKLPKIYATDEIRSEVKEELKFIIVDKIKDKLIKDNQIFLDIDGVRVNLKEGWWLLRASNTQNAIILRAEGNSVADLALVKQHCSKYIAGYGLSI